MKDTHFIYNFIMIKFKCQSHSSHKSAITPTNYEKNNKCKSSRTTNIAYQALCCYSNHVYLCNSIAWANPSFIVGNSWVLYRFCVFIKAISRREDSILNYFWLFTNKLSAFTIEKLDSININSLLYRTSNIKTSYAFAHLISIDISRKHSLLCFIILI